MDFKEKYMHIETELKAPKNLYNNFGKYKYRNAEGICEAVKPLLAKYKLTLTITDGVESIGDRIYVKSTCTLADAEANDGTVSTSAYAREPEEKKGMDLSQITGTASSYARKYALNGLFLLDDTKDADTNEYHEETEEAKGEAEMQKDAEKKLSPSEVATVKTLCVKKGFDPAKVFPKGVENLTSEQYVEAVKKLS